MEEPALYSWILAKPFCNLLNDYEALIQNPDLGDVMQCRKNMVGLINQIQHLIGVKKCDGETFKTALTLTPTVPLEILWLLHRSKILSLNEYIDRKCGSVVILSKSYIKALEEVSSTDQKIVKCMCSDLLVEILACDLNNDLKSNIAMKMSHVHISKLKLLSEILQEASNKTLQVNNFAKELLFKLFSCKTIEIGQVLQQQAIVYDLVSTNTEKIMFFKNMFEMKILNLTQTEDISNFVITKKLETNWDNLFTFIFCFGKNFADGFLMIHQVLKKLLDSALQNLDSNLLLCVFLITRFCCWKSDNYFKSYLHWFAATFSSESNRPLNSSQTASFFMQFLTDQIQTDLPCYLKVHINRVPYVPFDCYHLVSDYVKIVKTVFQDLNESIDLGLYENNSDMSNVKYDVKMLLASFENSGEIPSCILEASIFCKQYFEKKFLVELLSKFDGKHSTQHKIIMKLHSLGKIPNLLFFQYKQLMY